MPESVKNIKENKNNDKEFRKSTELVFKKILRSLSWIVGISFILIIILPMFDSPMLDIITRGLFYLGILSLIIFSVLEFVADSIKQKIETFLEKNESTSTNH